MFGVGRVCTRGCTFGFEGCLIFRNGGLISALLCLGGGVTLVKIQVAGYRLQVENQKR